MPQCVLPRRNFKEYCARMSINTCAIQYLSDHVMGPDFGCDYGIACCVSGELQPRPHWEDISYACSHTPHARTLDSLGAHCQAVILSMPPAAMRIGKDMQFFGARCNLPKLLLYTMNNGRDEVSGDQVAPRWDDLVEEGKPLDYDTVLAAFDRGMDWLAELYVNTMNCIHYSHDKYK